MQISKATCYFGLVYAMDDTPDTTERPVGQGYKPWEAHLLHVAATADAQFRNGTICRVDVAMLSL